MDQFILRIWLDAFHKIFIGKRLVEGDKGYPSRLQVFIKTPPKLLPVFQGQFSQRAPLNNRKRIINCQVGFAGAGRPVKDAIEWMPMGRGHLIICLWLIGQVELLNQVFQLPVLALCSNVIDLQASRH